MKLLRDGKMFVDKTDLAYLERIPSAIFHEFESFFSFDQFAIFTKKEAIDYFLNSYIIDYDSIKDLNNDELNQAILLIKKRLYDLKMEWLKSSYKVKKKLRCNIKRRSFTKYLNYSLETLINYKNNKSYYDKIVKDYFDAKTLRRC